MKNTFVKVLSMMMALMMVVGMFSIVTVSAAECTHANATPSGAPVAPKCNAVGYTWYACPDCGASFKGDSKPATGVHNPVAFYAEGKGPNATCTDPAYDAGSKCADCGFVIKPSLPKEGAQFAAKGHTFANGTITEKTLCTDAVWVVYLCTGCGKPSHELAPDPAAAGYPVPVLLEAGATDHAWNEYVVKTAPVLACDSTVVERTCKKCPAVQTYTTPEKHNLVTWNAATDVPGYVQNQYCGEYLSYKVCTYCGEKSDVKLNPNRNAHGKEVISAMTSELRNNATFVNWCNANGKNYLTLADGTAIGKAATCSKEGFTLYYCKHCNTYREETQNKLNHTITYEEEIGSSDGLCAPEVRVVKKCANYSTCKYKETVSVITPAVQHVPVKDTANSTAATCVASGVSITKCQTCGTKLSEQYSPATGHTWGAYYYSNAAGAQVSVNNCTNGIYQARKCTVQGCGVIDTVVTVLAPCASHTMSTGSDYKTHDATCSTGEYGYFYCTNSALCEGFDKEANKVAGTINNDKRLPSEHVPYAAGMVELTGKRVEPTCTTNGQMTYICSCGAELTRTLNATGHQNKESNILWVNPNNADHKVDVRAVAPNCITEGFKAGEVCKTCGTVTVARVSLGKKADTHAKAYTYIKTVAPTCLSAGYDEVRYDKCCDAKATANPVPKLTACATATVKVVNVAAPSCTAKGAHAYKICTVCQKITDATTVGCTFAGCNAESHSILNSKISAGVVTVADLEIDALGHDFSDKGYNKRPAIPETCDADGRTEYFVCANGCGEHTAYTTIRAHARATQYFAAKEANCFQAGLNAGNYCPKCINIEGTPDYINAHAGKAKRTHTYGATIVNGADYIFVNLETYGGKPVDCTKAAYILKVCTQSNCGYIEMLENTFVAAKSEHNWSVTTNTTDVVKTEGQVPTGNQTYACWGSGYTSKNCADCGQESGKVSKNDQIKHYYYVEGKKVEIDTTCANIGKYEGVRCALCNCEVKSAQDAVANWATGAIIGAVHTYKTDKVNAAFNGTAWVGTSCTEYGYVSEYCVSCQKEKVATITVNPLNPTLNPYLNNKAEDGIDSAKVKALIETKAPAVGVEGFVKYVCAKCGLTHTYTLAALGTPATVTITTSAAAVTAGDTITATFKFANVVAKFNVLELVLNTNGMFNASDVNAVATGFGTEVEVIANGNNIMIYPANTAELVNLTADMTATVTLTLEAKGAACGLVEIAVTSATAKIVGENAPKNVAIDDKTVKVQISALGNANGDILLGKDEINAVDYREVYLYAQKVVTGEAEYAVKYDINRDGVVTMADARDLKTFVLSGKTVADYLNMLNYEFDKVIKDGVEITNSNYTEVIGLDLASVIWFAPVAD